MSEERRLTRIVYDAFVAVVESGQTHVRPGHVVEYLRDRNNPLDQWNIIGEFTKLQRLGVIKVDQSTALWELEPNLTFADAIAHQNGSEG